MKGAYRDITDQPRLSFNRRSAGIGPLMLVQGNRQLSFNRENVAYWATKRLSMSLVAYIPFILIDLDPDEGEKASMI